MIADWYEVDAKIDSHESRVTNAMVDVDAESRTWHESRDPRQNAEYYSSVGR